MISQLVTGQHCVIRVRGELDAHCVFELRDRVTRAFANYGSIQVDLSEVKTLDTAGRSMLDFALNCIADVPGDAARHTIRGN